jgi:ABC-type glycerol-3-phosphate transport system permease component
MLPRITGRFIWSWNDFLLQLMYRADPDTYTLQLGLRMFVDRPAAPPSARCSRCPSSR